jgi:hypothetical protein
MAGTRLALSDRSMRAYLAKSMSSVNANKLNGLLAEADFRRHLSALGYAQQVSPGGWIARRVGVNQFGHDTVVMFPESITPGTEYGPSRPPPHPSNGLHTICSTFHQSGISAFFCSPTLLANDDPMSMSWKSIQLGVPSTQAWQPFPASMANYFTPRSRRYNFLSYRAKTSSIPANVVGEEFAKEHLRVTFRSAYMAEISDVDGILWGQQLTYPIEIKEKTAGYHNGMGKYFGIDVGPFVKLAFYAAKRGNLHSLFVVREITDTQTRALANWWYITFEQLARFATWGEIGGGTNMQGGRSSVIRVPRCEFLPLDKAHIAQL